MSTKSGARGDPYIGKLIQDRFQILRRIAAGGMGVVYEARQKPLDRPVALKILKSFTDDEEMEATFRERFFREAAAVARLNHPNTLIVHDYGETEEGSFFIAMEMLEGETLTEAIKKNGPLSSRAAVHVGVQICNALDDAHCAGLIHRDLKSSNIMLLQRNNDPYFVKVLDFGLVKKIDAEQDSLDLTKSGVTMGSPHYMAPEQVKGLPVDARADIYAFGALMYHAIVGAPPFAGKKNGFETMAAHVSEMPKPFREAWPSCPAPPELEEVVLRCLEKDPKDRFFSMGELKRVLKRQWRRLSTDQLNAVSFSGEALMVDSDDFALPTIPGIGAETLAELLDSSQRALPADSVSEVSGPRVKQEARDKGERAAEKQEETSQETDREELHSPLGSLPPPAPASGREDVVVLGAPLLANLGPAPEPDRPGSARLAGALAGLVLALAIGFGAFFALRGPAEAPPAPSPPPSVPRTHTVRLVSEPPGVRVSVEGADYGDAPVLLEVPEGESRTVLLVMPGYETRTIQVSSRQPEVHVRLYAAQAEPEPELVSEPERVSEPEPEPEPEREP